METSHQSDRCKKKDNSCNVLRLLRLFRSALLRFEYKFCERRSLFTCRILGKLGAALCFGLLTFNCGLLFGGNAHTLAFLCDQFLLLLLQSAALFRFCPGLLNLLSTLPLQPNRLRIEQVTAIFRGEVRMPQCRRTSDCILFLDA